MSVAWKRHDSQDGSVFHIPYEQREATPVDENDEVNSAPEVLIDPDDAVTSIRKTASGRRFALGKWHPDMMRVDPETFWLAWRDGVNWAWTSSAKLNGMLTAAAECIVLLTQAKAAAPDVCPHCGTVLEER